MKTQINRCIRPTLALAAITLLLQPAALAQQTDSSSGQEKVMAQQPVVSPAGKMTVAEAQPGEQQLPDSPGAMQSQTNAGSQQPPQQQQNRLHEPVGTAAAEWMPITGVAASRPAGAALAPAKQRRVRSILIKVGALVGAGVAVGTVAALSAASPSRPAGAH